MDDYTVRALGADEARRRLGELSAVLCDCVDGGASVSFMWPMTADKAERFWRGVIDGLAAGDRLLLVAEAGEIAGTVQVVFAGPENQPHRGDVAKMLVRRSARQRGLGARLLRAAEASARQAGKTLLLLDTVTGSDAARLYAREGWVEVGSVPQAASTNGHQHH